MLFAYHTSCRNNHHLRHPPTSVETAKPAGAGLHRCEAKLAKSAQDEAQGIPPNTKDGKLAWCKDFLIADEQGLNSGGSCCFKDEQRAAWCKQVRSAGCILQEGATERESSTPAANIPVALRLIIRLHGASRCDR